MVPLLPRRDNMGGVERLGRICPALLIRLPESWAGAGQTTLMHRNGMGSKKRISGEIIHRLFRLLVSSSI
jgi:hypothetical protein